MSWRIARHPDRAVALLRQGGVIDDQDRIQAADEAIGLAEQRPLQRRLIPDPGRDEVVQPVVGDPLGPGRHRLDALAITEADQPGHIERAHRPACGMGQSRKEWLQPPIQILTPSAST